MSISNHNEIPLKAGQKLAPWFRRVLELWNMFMQTTLSSPVPIYCVPQGALEYCQGSSNQQQATSNALHATNSIQSGPFSPPCTVIRALDELSSIANTNAIGWQIQMEFGSKYKWNSFTNAIWTRSPVGWELVWPPSPRSIVSPQRGAGIWTVRTGSCSLITLFASPAQYGVWCCALPSTAEQAAFRDCEVDAKQAVDAVEREESSGCLLELPCPQKSLSSVYLGGRPGLPATHCHHYFSKRHHPPPTIYTSLSNLLMEIRLPRFYNQQIDLTGNPGFLNSIS